MTGRDGDGRSCCGRQEPGEGRAGNSKASDAMARSAAALLWLLRAFGYNWAVPLLLQALTAAAEVAGTTRALQDASEPHGEAAGRGRWAALMVESELWLEFLFSHPFFLDLS